MAAVYGLHRLVDVRMMVSANPAPWHWQIFSHSLVKSIKELVPSLRISQQQYQLNRQAYSNRSQLKISYLLHSLHSRSHNQHRRPSHLSIDQEHHIPTNTSFLTTQESCSTQPQPVLSHHSPMFILRTITTTPRWALLCLVNNTTRCKHPCILRRMDTTPIIAMVAYRPWSYHPGEATTGVIHRIVQCLGVWWDISERHEQKLKSSRQCIRSQVVILVYALYVVQLFLDHMDRGGEGRVIRGWRVKRRSWIGYVQR